MDQRAALWQETNEALPFPTTGRKRSGRLKTTLLITNALTKFIRSMHCWDFPGSIPTFSAVVQG